jgi:hypothetical protein
MRRQTELQNSVRAPIRKTMRGVVERLLIFLWGGSSKQYWPETHYMRGPGPKWLEKHGGGLKEGSNLVKVLNATHDKWNA